MAHRCSCSCHCQCHRKMYWPAPIVQNNYYYVSVSPQQVLVGPNQLLQQIVPASPVAKIPALPAPSGRREYAIKNDKLRDKHRDPRPIANDKHQRCGTKNAKSSGEKHRDARQISGGAANDKKVRENHHRVKGEPKQKVHVDAKPRVKCANGGTRHKY